MYFNDTSNIIKVVIFHFVYEMDISLCTKRPFLFYIRNNLNWLYFYC